MFLAGALEGGIASPARAEEPLSLRLSLPASYYVKTSSEVQATHSLQQDEINAPSLRRECKARYMVGPAVGIPLGVGSMIVGGLMVGAGTNFSVLGSDGSNVPGLIGGGSALLAAGAGALVFSAIKAKRNVKTRARVCRP